MLEPVAPISNGASISNTALLIIDDYIDYYNNRRYQWQLAKLSPNEYYKFVTTGVYPLDIPNIPAIPVISKDAKDLGLEAVNIDNE